MLRSKYAAPETPTEVVLTFEYAGKKYTIRRSPEYERPAKRGGGTTLQKAAAELTYPDGRVLSKPKEVTEAVEELLGLKRSQFSQIAMIAQGDFLKLLLAPTDERRKIFRRIFKTERLTGFRSVCATKPLSLPRAVKICKMPSGGKPSASHAAGTKFWKPN